MADFEALPVDTGTGPYHFNRFRVTFQKQLGMSKEAYGRDFVTHFPFFFNSAYATVEQDKEHSFEDKPVLRFHGFDKIAGFDLASAHDDWVVQFALNPNFGFMAQTLKRKFRLLMDAGMAAEGLTGGGIVGAGVGALGGSRIGPVGAGLGAAVLGVLGASTGAVTAYNSNFYHFLAGWRGWRLDDAAVFGVSGDDLVLETSAVERFSCEFYEISDKALKLESHIPPIWNSMLTNFVKIKGVVVPPAATPAGWKRDGFNLTTDSLYTVFDTLNDLKAYGEFHRTLALYPYLLPDNLR